MSQFKRYRALCQAHLTSFCGNFGQRMQEGKAKGQRAPGVASGVVQRLSWKIWVRAIRTASVMNRPIPTIMNRMVKIFPARVTGARAG